LTLVVGEEVASQSLQDFAKFFFSRRLPSTRLNDRRARSPLLLPGRRAARSHKYPGAIRKCVATIQNPDLQHRRAARERHEPNPLASDGSATMLLRGGEGIRKHRKLKT
jgi:hypothetical protein